MHRAAGMSKSTFYRKRQEALSATIRSVEGIVAKRRCLESNKLEVPVYVSKGPDSFCEGDVPCRNNAPSNIPSDSEWGNASMVLTSPSEFGSAVSRPNEDDGCPVLLKDMLRSGLKDWSIKHNITHAAINDLLEVCRSSGIQLPKDARTLLQTDPFKAPVVVMGEGEYLHMGFKKQLLSSCIKLHTTTTFNEVLVSFNIDGQKPYENSKDQLWPILCQVEVGKIRLQPFLVGAYYGRKKPDILTYCEAWIPEVVNVLSSGLTLPGGNCAVSIKSIICDAPALAYVKGTKLHSGFFGCQRCFAKGTTVDGRRVFLKLDALLRTDKNFRLKTQSEHHTCNTPFADIAGLDLIQHFPLDVMHLLYLGVTKRVCMALKEGVTLYKQKRVNDVVKFFPSSQRKRKLLIVGSELTINKMIATINHYRPSEFARPMSPFSDYSSWKATECRQFLLYISVVVLKGNFSSNVLFEHFCLLYCAARILTGTKLTADYDLAEKLLRRFVKDSVQHYSENFCVYNIHSLIHLADDARFYGPLDSVTAFPFENYQGTIRKMLRGKYRPLAQLWKRIGEQDVQVAEKSGCDFGEINKPLRRSESGNRPSCGIRGTHYKSVWHSSGVTFTLGLKDNVLSLLDGTTVSAENFILEDETLWVVGRYFKKTEDFFKYPIRSSAVGVRSVQGLSDICYTWPMTEVKCKIYLMPYKNRHVAIEMLH